MKTKAKLSIAAPVLLLAVMLTSSVVASPENDSRTATPIQHVVVIFQENVSHDHYFATYPVAATPAGAPSDRCGLGPRLPLLVISPYSKQNYVDGTLTDQTSILKFIEYNWNLPSIGPLSFDQKARTLLNMLDFSHGHEADKLFLDPSSGLPTSQENQPND
jgi:phospholipase C